MAEYLLADLKNIASVKLQASSIPGRNADSVRVIEILGYGTAIS